MTHKNLEMVQRIDFDRLGALVGERITALKLYAQNIDKEAGGKELHDAICRDLILPCVSLLMTFLESVRINEEK